MKTKTLLLLLLLSLTAADVMAQGVVERKKPKPTTTQQTKPKKQKPTPRSTPEEAGYDVTFSCNVPSATLYIDGNANGNASGSRFLKTGSHTIKVTANGYEEYTKQITVNRQNRTCSISLVKKKGMNETIKVGDVEFVMVHVEGGTFTMGATSEQGSDALSWEEPAHQVALSSYYIGQTEVTQALWTAVMGETVSQIATRNGWSTYGVGDNYPMYYVSWDDCQEFVRKLNQLTGKNFRLPTEAEWEYAARGGSKSRGYKYSGSNTLGSVAWYADNSGKAAHPVGTKSSNELGLYDMSGNVWEWCQDWYGDYSSSPQTNPKGSNSGLYRVIRGGSWGFNARYCRVSYRDINTPSFRGDSLGLRLVLSE